MIDDKRMNDLDNLVYKQQEELRQYESLGKIEVKELAIEYKKLCNLIECKKDNN